MLAHTARIAVVATFLVAVLSQARAEGPQVAQPVQGMVVLRNGEVLAGKITKFEDLYLVDLAHGRIRVKQADVELICGSMEEGYQKKRATIQVGNVHDHLDLAQWCLRHNLLGQASVELADARVADPKNPMVGALQHRLKMAMEPPIPSGTKTPLPSGPSTGELDRMLRGMPRGAVETFTQSVQPVLLNHCASGGCHGSQSETGLRLYRSVGTTSSRRMTQRNIHSVLSFIDLEKPSSSRLLVAASGPHGTAEHAIFGEREAAQYQQIANWVNLLAGPTTPEIPASVARGTSSKGAEELFGETAPKVLAAESGKALPLASAKRHRTNRRPGALGKADEAKPASFEEPADPFDPEVFNRRYGPAKGKPSDSTAKK